MHLFVVFLFALENRAFDHFMGYFPGVDGLTGKEYNLANTTNPNSQKYYVNKKATYIAKCDPDHGATATTYKVFGEAAILKSNFTVANMDGFVEFELGHRGNTCDVMDAFTPDKLPILTTLAKEFCIMDRYFCSMAGPTWPNRMYALSGTSYGATSTGPWYQDKPGTLFPQKTIFDQITENGLTWKNYYNDTPWELFMDTIAHNPQNGASLDQFFDDAARGTLPSFSWINPRSGINMTTGYGSNDMHPTHDVALGEGYYKDIYEAVRASPQWERTLFIITFDEHGGFYDHVPTPLNVPEPDNQPSFPTQNFKFNRLGIRVPTLLISPWIKKGTVLTHAPTKQKPFKNSEYEGTSIIATTRKLLGMKLTPLTKRDAWSATFEHILDDLDSPRKDCPMHLPDAPEPTVGYLEAEAPIHDLQTDIIDVLSHLNDVKVPKHTKQGQVSKWMMDHFHKHKHVTHQWKNSKYRKNVQATNYTVHCMPCRLPAKNFDISWLIDSASSNSNVRTKTRPSSDSYLFSTISSRKLKNGDDVHYCLDSGNSEEGSLVHVSLCYPTSNPYKNRDKNQHWIFGKDATIRPYSFSQDLCVTNRQYQNDSRLYLEKCQDRVEQKWSYHGKAPGNGDTGYLYFGDATNCMRISGE